jgi:hypothetical protein
MRQLSPLRRVVAALEHLWDLRGRLPREQVSPVATPAWIRHLEAFPTGDWQAAKTAAEEKLADPGHDALTGGHGTRLTL